MNGILFLVFHLPVVFFFLSLFGQCIDTLGQEFFTADMLSAIFAIIDKTMKDHFVREHRRQEKRRDEDYDEVLKSCSLHLTMFSCILFNIFMYSNDQLSIIY